MQLHSGIVHSVKTQPLSCCRCMILACLAVKMKFHPKYLLLTEHLWLRNARLADASVVVIIELVKTVLAHSILTTGR